VNWIDVAQIGGGGISYYKDGRAWIGSIWPMMGARGRLL
jgi:hypothetical protein